MSKSNNMINYYYFLKRNMPWPLWEVWIVHILAWNIIMLFTIVNIFEAYEATYSFSHCFLDIVIKKIMLSKILHCIIWSINFNKTKGSRLKTPISFYYYYYYYYCSSSSSVFLTIFINNFFFKYKFISFSHYLFFFNFSF